MSSCHICKRTGVRTCDPEEAEIKCTICGWCETHKPDVVRDGINGFKSNKRIGDYA